MERQLKKLITYFLFFGILLFPILLFAIPASHHWRPSKIYIDTNLYYGSVNGFAQTPSGGSPGTSSNERPTLDELGIDHTLFYDCLIGSQWQRFGLYGGYQRIRPNGTSTLSTTLVTHGITIPAGTAGNSDLQFDWYRVGGGYDFYFHKLTLTPEIELAYLKFSYLLNYGSATKRSYSPATMRVGLNSLYQFNSHIALNITAVTSTYLTALNITDLQARMKFKILQHRSFATTFFVGTGYTRISFKDKQPLPNHVLFNTGLLATTGLEFSFGG